MPAISFARATFKRLDMRFRQVNMFFEQTPANPEDQVSIIQRAGIEQFLSQGSSPVRGIFCQQGTFSGDYVIVLGTTAYRVTFGGAATSLGTVAGTGRVVMAGNATVVVIATGTTLYSTNGTTVSTVTFPDAANVVFVAFINGYFLAVRGASQRVYFSAINAATFDALDYFSAENSPDDLVACMVVGDILWLLGKSSIEPHQPTGDGSLPFLQIAGRLYGIGCANADSIGQLSDGFAFVGADRKPYRLADEPRAILDLTLLEWLRDVTAANLKGWSYAADSHEFWVIGNGSQSYAYDATTGMAHEMASYGRNGFRGHVGCTGLGPLDRVCGDDTTGKVWRFNPALNQDDGGVLSREWSGVVDAQGRVPCHRVILDCNVGSAGLDYPDDDPMCELRTADDRGFNFGDWRAAPMGRQGEFHQIVRWKGLGPMRRPGRVFNFRVTQNVRITARRAWFNEAEPAR